MSDYTDYECHLVFLVRLGEAMAAHDWPKAHAIWRQLSAYHHLEPIQQLGATILAHEAELMESSSTRIH